MREELTQDSMGTETQGRDRVCLWTRNFQARRESVGRKFDTPLRHDKAVPSLCPNLSHEQRGKRQEEKNTVPSCFARGVDWAEGCSTDGRRWLGGLRLSRLGVLIKWRTDSNTNKETSERRLLAQSRDTGAPFVERVMKLFLKDTTIISEKLSQAN